MQQLSRMLDASCIGIPRELLTGLLSEAKLPPRGLMSKGSGFWDLEFGVLSLGFWGLEICAFGVQAFSSRFPCKPWNTRSPSLEN